MQQAITHDIHLKGRQKSRAYDTFVCFFFLIIRITEKKNRKKGKEIKLLPTFRKGTFVVRGTHAEMFPNHHHFFLSPPGKIIDYKKKKFSSISGPSNSVIYLATVPTSPEQNEHGVERNS